MPKHCVSAIVPAFNEEKTVFNVISILQSSSVINEVICVNDGSTDSTKEILERFKNDKKVKVINLDKNKGKGNALAVGIKHSKGDILLFIDADLINLTEEHIHSLLEPLLQGTHRAVLGYISGKGNRNIVADLTGQRAYLKKDLEPYIDEISKTRFGVETYLNKLFRAEDTIKVPLHNLKGLFKYEKQRADIALKEYLKEGVEIAKVIGNTEIISDEDMKVLQKILNISDINTLKKYLNKISNSKIKNSLQKYFNQYVDIIRKMYP